MIDHTTDIPTLRTAPPELARLLDTIEPSARLLYAGEGRWRLWRLAAGANEQAKRRLAGIKLLDGMLALDGLRVGGASARVAGAVTTALMALRGYRWEWDYNVIGEPNSSIADDFATRVWAERHIREDVRIEYMKSLATGDDRMAERIKRGVAHVRDNGGERHRQIFRKPVSVPVATTLRSA